MKNLIVILMLSLSLAGTAQTKSETEVAAAVEALRKAMVDADKSALENLVAAELSYGHSSGKIEDKSAFVQALVTGQSDFVDITLSDQTIRVKDKTAIVRHKLSANTNDAGKGPGTANIGVLLVWVKEKAGWKLMARQAFKL